MIQRMQSIYLFLVVLLMFFILIFPIAVLIIQDETVIRFFSYSVKRIVNEESIKVFSTFPIFILALTIGIINFYNIFLFKKRIKQMRICVYNMLLMVGMIVLILYYFNVIRNTFEITYYSFKIIMVLPIITIILNILAYRGIRRDELLVKSYERLRKK